MKIKTTPGASIVVNSDGCYYWNDVSITSFPAKAQTIEATKTALYVCFNSQYFFECSIDKNGIKLNFVKHGHVVFDGYIDPNYDLQTAINKANNIPVKGYIDSITNKTDLLFEIRPNGLLVWGGIEIGYTPDTIFGHIKASYLLRNKPCLLFDISPDIKARVCVVNDKEIELAFSDKSKTVYFVSRNRVREVMSNYINAMKILTN